MDHRNAIYNRKKRKFIYNRIEFSIIFTPLRVPLFETIHLVVEVNHFDSDYLQQKHQKYLQLRIKSYI